MMSDNPTNYEQLEQLRLAFHSIEDTRKFPNLKTLLEVIRMDGMNTSRYLHFRLMLVVIDTDSGDTFEYQLSTAYKQLSMAEALKEVSMLTQYLRSLDIHPGSDLRVRMDGWQPEAITEAHPTGWVEFASKTV